MTRPRLSERSLRYIWQRQLFTTSSLHTAEGKPVQVISPGIPNSDGGPDFKNAKIKIGGITFVGDVELHPDAADWEAHRHTSDPHYNPVILHVVMTAQNLTQPVRTQSRRPVPLMALQPFLDNALRSSLARSMVEEPAQRQQHIPCWRVNREIPRNIIRRWIITLAHERIEFKVRWFEARLKQLAEEQRVLLREPYPRYRGSADEIPNPQRNYAKRDFVHRGLWEQVLYEGMMEALGYAKNRAPFLALAQSVRLDVLRNYGVANGATVMALLFGAGGLLPSVRKVKEKESRAYLRSLKKRWKELRPAFRGKLLNEGDWLFFRLRPQNFPPARLAALCFILPALFGEDSFRKLIEIFKEGGSQHRKRVQTLHRLFAFRADNFWQYHYHFGGSAGKKGVSLGSGRINEIIVNVVAPVVLLYARIFNDQAVREHALRILEILPAGQENTVTRRIQADLMNTDARPNSALVQQGALQLYRFYCSVSRCLECEIGQTVYTTPGQTSPCQEIQ